MCIMNNNNNNNKSNHYNEKIKLNLLISLSVSIVLISVVIFLSTDEEKNIFKLSLGQEIKHTVPLDKILSGGPPQDGIPSIDNPKFQSVQEADEI